MTSRAERLFALCVVLSLAGVDRVRLRPVVWVYEKYMECASGVYGRCAGLAIPVVCLGMPGVQRADWVVLARSFPAEGSPAGQRCFCLLFWGAVRACTWLSAGSAARMARRTYI
jgi:hypothetical protein